MKTWAVTLFATAYIPIHLQRVVVRMLFVSAYDENQANEKAVKALFIIFPTKDGYKDHAFAVRDTQPMYDDLRKIQDWD